MIPVVSIVGRSGTGKTVLIERLIREFKRRGYRLVTVKHVPDGFDVDQPGKNSWRFARAGSDAVVLSSPERVALIKNTDHDPDVEEILRLAGPDFDLMLIEGFKRGSAPKIEVHRRELGDELLCSVESLRAVVTDGVLEGCDLPRLPLGDEAAVADFIEENFIRGQKEDVALSVNGRPVTMDPTVREAMGRSLVDTVSDLKGVGEIRSIELSLRVTEDAHPAVSEGGEQGVQVEGTRESLTRATGEERRRREG